MRFDAETLHERSRHLAFLDEHFPIRCRQLLAAMAAPSELRGAVVPAVVDVDMARQSDRRIERRIGKRLDDLIGAG